MQKIEQKDVVLLNASFFRFCGSHNDRMPLSLCYVSRFLEEEGISHVVFNADYTGAKSYWKWKWMFDNFDTFKDAVDGKSSLYGEIVEQIMSFSPKTVIIMAGEPMFSTTDLGNPYIGANFAKLLRKLGVYVVGFGPFYTVQPEKFIDSFDCLIKGEPSSRIKEIIAQKPKGVVSAGSLSTNVLPNLEHLFPSGQKKDSLLTSFGCAFNCAFCFAKKIRQSVNYVEMPTMVNDLLQRPEQKIYLADLNFTLSVQHLKNVAKAIKDNNIKKEFVVESRADTLDEERVALLKQIGVSTVKIGIEGITQEQLKVFNKKTTPEMNKKAIDLLKKNGLKVVGYFILGGKGVTKKDYEANLEWLQTLNLDYIVVNIWSYDFTTDYRYDTHFSPEALKRWGVPKEIFYRYLQLQQNFNPTVGRIIGF